MRAFRCKFEVFWVIGRLFADEGEKVCKGSAGK